MNANEVIANVGLELTGRRKGDYDALHPNNDVNMAQSSCRPAPLHQSECSIWNACSSGPTFVHRKQAAIDTNCVLRLKTAVGLTT
jgi:aspartate ammonia-lyase